MTARRKTDADDARDPDRREDAARRLPAGVDGLLAERAGGVEPVDDEHRHEEAEREVASMLPSVASSRTEVSNRTDGDWLFAKNSRMSANTSMPEDSVATPMLLRMASKLHAERVDQRVMISVVERDEREHVVTPSGDGLSRKPSAWPMIPSTTNATITATAVTVTTWAQK